MNPKNDTFALACIAFLSAIAMISGAFLVYKGFQSGETFATIAGSGLSGIVGYIGGKAVGRLENQTTLTTGGAETTLTTGATSPAAPLASTEIKP